MNGSSSFSLEYIGEELLKIWDELELLNIWDDDELLNIWDELSEMPQELEDWLKKASRKLGRDISNFNSEIKSLSFRPVLYI